MKLKNVFVFLNGIFFLFEFLGFLNAEVATNVIPRIGVVDLQRVYETAKLVDATSKELDRFREASNNEILARKKEIQLLKQERLTAFNTGDTKEYENLGHEIKKKDAGLKRFHQNASMEIRKIQRKAQSNKHIETQELSVSNAVSKIARTRGYTVVLIADNGGLLYWSEKVDITNEVIAQLVRTL